MGFRAMLVVPDGGVLEGSDESLRKALALGNGVFVRSGHERFEHLPSAEALDLGEGSTPPTIAWDCPEISRMCFRPSVGRKRYEPDDILGLVTREIADRRDRTHGPRLDVKSRAGAA